MRLFRLGRVRLGIGLGFLGGASVLGWRLGSAGGHALLVDFICILLGVGTRRSSSLSAGTGYSRLLATGIGRRSRFTAGSCLRGLHRSLLFGGQSVRADLVAVCLGIPARIG